MDKFDGFYQETLDFLIGITFNNNKEWFEAHKHMYTEYLKKPITLMAHELFDKLHAMDNNFTAMPKISRINRDVRFSKDKTPYKRCIWFFFREDGSPGIQNKKPTFFFDVMADKYRYGLSYAPIDAGDLKKMRSKMAAGIPELQKHISWFKKQKGYILEGEKYKKNFSEGMPEDIADWMQRKEICLIKYCEIDDLFFKRELLEEVFKEFKKFYKLYNYFDDIAD